MSKTPPASPALVLAVLTLGCGGFTLLQSLLNPVLPEIARDLGISATAASWVLIAWLLSAAVATPILGRVGDMIGKARTLEIGLLAIAGGGLVAAASPSLPGVLAGRVIQGLGGAVIPLSFGLVRDALPRARVPSAIGLLSSVIAVGGGLGSVLAGPIVALAGWRGLFWIPALATLATLAVARAVLPRGEGGAGGRINWLAAAALGGWLVALLLALTEGPRWGWTSAPVLGLGLLALGLAGLWLTVEATSREPLIDLRLMRLRTVWTVNLASTLLGAAMFAIWVFVPQMVQVPASTGWGFGLSVGASGWALAPMLAAMALSGALSGRLLPVLPLRAQLAGGAAGIAAASAALALAHGSLPLVIAETVVFGTALGLAYAAMTSLVVEAVPAAQTGVATGMASNLRIIGGALGTAIMAAVLVGGTEGGYVAGFLVFAGLSAVTALAALGLPRPRALAVPA